MRQHRWRRPRTGKRSRVSPLTFEARSPRGGRIQLTLFGLLPGGAQASAIALHIGLDIGTLTLVQQCFQRRARIPGMLLWGAADWVCDVAAIVASLWSAAPAGLIRAGTASAMAIAAAASRGEVSFMSAPIVGCPTVIRRFAPTVIGAFPYFIGGRRRLVFAPAGRPGRRTVGDERQRTRLAHPSASGSRSLLACQRSQLSFAPS